MGGKWAQGGCRRRVRGRDDGEEPVEDPIPFPGCTMPSGHPTAGRLPFTEHGSQAGEPRAGALLSLAPVEGAGEETEAQVTVLKVTRGEAESKAAWWRPGNGGLSPTPTSLPLDTEHGRNPATHSIHPDREKRGRGRGGTPFPQRVSDSGEEPASRLQASARTQPLARPPCVSEAAPPSPRGARRREREGGRAPCPRAVRSEVRRLHPNQEIVPEAPPPDPEPGGVASPAPPPPPPTRATGSVPLRVRAPLTRGPLARAPRTPGSPRSRAG